MQEIITSFANDKIKNIIKLEKANVRRELGLFIIEGLREIKLCANSGYQISAVYYCKELVNEVAFNELLLHTNANLIEVNKAVFNKLVYRDNKNGLIAIVKSKYLSLDEIKLSNNPLIIVLEAIEKPGNLGAILRTADAAKADAVIICDKKTDVFNPNVIRASIGTLFTNQVVCCATNECIDWLKNNHIISYAAALSATKYYHDFDYTKPSAIVMGTEADGLSTTWLNESNHQIKIPMLGKIDSLNVSTSCAVLTFEIMRQRNFQTT